MPAFTSEAHSEVQTNLDKTGRPYQNQTTDQTNKTKAIKAGWLLRSFQDAIKLGRVTSMKWMLPHYTEEEPEEVSWKILIKIVNQLPE